MQIINPAAGTASPRQKDTAVPSTGQKGKAALIRQVHEAGLHRRMWQAADARRPSVIVTFGSNPEAGAQWFRKTTGQSPAGTIDLTGRFPGSLKLGRLKSDPSLLPILFGKAVRRAAIRLAQAGVVSCVFAEPQPFKMGKFDADYLNSNKQPLFDLFNLLADAESRLTLASILKHRITGDHGYLRIARYPEYEHPRCRALPGDTVCDVGAHDGQSSIRFANQVGATGRVLALEPDALNVAKIEAGLQSANVTNVQIVQAALAESPGTLSFSGGQGGSSRLSEDGDISVRATSIDELARDFALGPATLFSFDIEGQELPALRGGLETIRRLRPKLQVSIYHLMSDLYEIPLLLAGSLENYRYFLGHHDAYHTETDLYAVPEEMLAD